MVMTDRRLATDTVANVDAIVNRAETIIGAQRSEARKRAEEINKERLAAARIVFAANVYLKEKNWKLAFLFIPSVFITHFVYGILFIKGFFRSWDISCNKKRRFFNIYFVFFG